MLCHWSGMEKGVSQSQRVVRFQRSHCGFVTVALTHSSWGRRGTRPHPKARSTKISTHRERVVVASSLTNTQVASFPRPEIFFFSFPPSVPNSTDKLSGHDSSRTQKTPSNCPHERESRISLLRQPPSPKGPPKPRGPLTVLESSSCRDCASTLSTPAWSMKVTKPKPLRRVVRERQMVTRTASGRGGRGEPGGRRGFRDSPGSFGQGVPHHQTLFHLPELAEVFAQPFCNHTLAFGPAQARSPSPSSTVLCPR